MTPYLQIAFQRGCAFFKIGSFKNRVCPMLLTHAEHGCLKPVLTLQCVIIGKKVELENAGAVLNVVCSNSQTSVKEPVICLPVKLFQHCVGDFLTAVGSVSESGCAVAVCRVESAVEVDG